MALDTNKTVTEVLARFEASRNPLPAEAPTQAPTPVEVPTEVSSPADPWEMERTGIQWCDCGEDHELDRSDVLIDLEEQRIKLQETRYVVPRVNLSAKVFWCFIGFVGEAGVRGLE